MKTTIYTPMTITFYFSCLTFLAFWFTFDIRFLSLTFGSFLLSIVFLKLEKKKRGYDYGRPTRTNIKLSSRH
jgi:hypothetical protein